MSEDTVKSDSPTVPESEPEVAMETTSQAESATVEEKSSPLPSVEDEDKPTPLPTVTEDVKPAPLPTATLTATEKDKPPFKKPMDIKKPQLSPEKAEEAKLNAKYGKVKPGGSDFLRKKLNKGVKYFDSGDYNMEQQSGKLRNRGKPPGLAGPPGVRLPVQSPLGQATGKTIPTPASIPHRKQSTEISKLAV
ncbi:cAMP-regulated phosphoprotein 19-B-like [Asterias amurensis]|uniref:cAMP-regulated phosphoprotein 19-B-like n=1 Tax=Asterias amurensis TaxID=7602 RepID=UPI003AB39145